MVGKFCEKYLALVRERQRIVRESILSGRLQTMEDYRRCIGKLEGLDEAEILLKDLYTKFYDLKDLQVIRSEHEKEVTSQSHEFY